MTFEILPRNNPDKCIKREKIWSGVKEINHPGEGKNPIRDTCEKNRPFYMSSKNLLTISMDMLQIGAL